MHAGGGFGMSTHGELPGEVESGRHGSPSDSMQSVRSRSPGAKLAPLVTAPVMGLRGLQQFLNKSVSLLKGMDGTALGELAASLETRIFQDGDAIIAEGERADCMYFVETGGAIAIVGGKVVRKYSRGDYFGERGLLFKEARAATVNAEGEVTCFKLGRQAFEKVAGVGQEEMLLLAQDYETTAKSAEDARRVQEQQKMQAVLKAKLGTPTTGKPSLWRTGLKAKIHMVGMLAETHKSVNSMYGRTLNAEKEALIRDDGEQETPCCCVRGHLCVMHPNTTFRGVWDVVQVMLLVNIAFSVPYRVAFNSDPDVGSVSFWFEVMVDMYFIVDVVMNFFVAFWSHAQLEVKHAVISRNYLSGWFVIDLVACLPVQYVQYAFNGVESGAGDADGLKITKVMRLLKITKMLRIARLKRLLERHLDELEVVMRVASIIAMVISTFLISHLLGCTWYFVGSSNELLPNGVRVYGWVQRYIQDVDAGENATELLLGHDGADAWTMYLTAMYWAVTTVTTVGYGDITAATNAEKATASISMLVGGFAFGLTAASFTSVFTARNLQQSKYNERMTRLREYLTSKQVAKHLRKRIIMYYESYYGSSPVFEEKQMLTRLPTSMRTEVVRHNFKRQVSGQLMKGLNTEEINQVCLEFEPLYPGPANTVIVKQGKPATELYVVVAGQIRKCVVEPDASITDVSSDSAFECGSYFGELEHLTAKAWQATYSTMTNNAELCILRKQVLQRLFEDIPTLHTNVVHLSSKRHQRRRSLARKRAQTLLPAKVSGHVPAGSKPPKVRPRFRTADDDTADQDSTDSPTTQQLNSLLRDTSFPPPRTLQHKLDGIGENLIERQKAGDPSSPIRSGSLRSGSWSDKKLDDALGLLKDLVASQAALQARTGRIESALEKMTIPNRIDM